MIEIQKYSDITKILYELRKEDHAVRISSLDGNDSINIPIDVVDWIISELQDYRDDCNFNNSVKEKDHA